MSVLAICEECSRQFLKNNAFDVQTRCINCLRKEKTAQARSKQQIIEPKSNTEPSDKPLESVEPKNLDSKPVKVAHKIDTPNFVQLAHDYWEDN